METRKGGGGGGGVDRAGKRRDGADEGREGSASVTEEGDRQGKGDSTERERGVMKGGKQNRRE